MKLTALLALILTLALGGCSGETQEPTGRTRNGANANFSGGNNGDGGGN